MTAHSLVVEWDLPAEDGRTLYAAMLQAALHEARASSEIVGLQFVGRWSEAGSADANAALEHDGWATAIVRTPMLGFLTVKTLVASVSSTAPETDRIADRVRLAWTGDQAGPLRFTARAHRVPNGQPEDLLFELSTERRATFAIFTAPPSSVERFRATADAIAASHTAQLHFREEI